VVLSKPDILKYLKGGTLRFDPPLPDGAVKQVSVDLRLGKKFTRFKEIPGYLPAIQMDKSLWQSADLWEHVEHDRYRLNPGEFVLAQTLETVVIPNDLVGLVEGRSSWARMGVTIHLTAPKIDPGFNGPITLEMANFTKAPIELRAGVDKPAQLMLLRITSPLPDDELYGCEDTDIFQYQQDPIPYRPK